MERACRRRQYMPLTRIIHDGCTRRYAAPTSLAAGLARPGGRARRSVGQSFDPSTSLRVVSPSNHYPALPGGACSGLTLSGARAPSKRQQPVLGCLPSSRLHAPVSHGVSAVSLRTLMNNAD